MKTLDEVIANLGDAIEHLSAMMVSIETWNDALHYLKEYQTILPLVPSLINTALAVQKKGKTIG